jgi:hypothetical protein
MQQAQHIDRAQETNSEQAVEPRYLVRDSNAGAAQVETAADPTFVNNSINIRSEFKAACEKITEK